MSILRLGSSGVEVEQLQNDLAEIDESVEATGVFDTVTEEALQRLQFRTFRGTTHPVDGVYSVATAAVLADLVKAATEKKKRKKAADAEPKPEPKPADLPLTSAVPTLAPVDGSEKRNKKAPDDTSLVNDPAPAEEAPDDQRTSAASRGSKR